MRLLTALLALVALATLGACGDDDDDAATTTAGGEATSTAGEATTTTTAAGAEETATTAGDDGSEVGGEIEISDPADPPDVDDDDQAGLAAECFDGDLGACDELYFASDFGSEAEIYGATCGGRVSEGENLAGQCERTLG